MSTLQDLVVKVGVDDRGAEKGASSIRSKLERTWEGVKKSAAVAGATVGTVLTASLVKGMDVEAASDRLAASVGAFGPEAQKLGKVAGDLYAGAWGESMDEVGDAVAAVYTSIDGMTTASGDSLEAMTAKILNIATAFAVDVPRAAQLAGQLVRSGLAKNATQALDLLTVSLQKVPAAVRDDLLDALDEYGPFLKSIGITGSRAFGLLVKGAEKGMYGIDKTGDALKEFTIRATDMSTASKVGFDILGMSQDKMAGKLLAGGKTASKAFDQIISGLLGLKDPVDQSRAALALFGTPMEDLSVAEIPKFLKSLQEGKTGLGDVAGAADAMGQTLNDNAKNQLESFRRSVEQKLIQKGAEAIPTLKTMGQWLQRNAGWVVPLVTALGTFAAVVYLIVTAMKIWTAVQWALNIAMTANPIGLIILAIVALVAGFVILWNKCEGFRKFWIGLWNIIKSAALAVGRWFRDVLWGQWIKGAWNAIIEGGKSLIAWYIKLPGMFRDIFLKVADFITAPFRAAFNFVARAWNNTIGKLAWSVPDWVPIIGGKTIQAPKLPTFHRGGISQDEGLALVRRNEGIFTPDQMRHLAPVGSGGGGRVQLVLSGGDSRVKNLLLELLREGIRSRGGDPVEVLAPARARA